MLQYEYYCASMLMLLKPWRSIDDLKSQHHTWQAAFEDFINNAPACLKRIISSIEYFHECRNAADNAINRSPTDSINPNDTDIQSPLNTDTPTNQQHNIIDPEPVMTTQQIEEDWHGRLAVETARGLGLFADTTSFWPIREGQSVFDASTDDYTKLLVWRKQLEDDVLQCNKTDSTPINNAVFPNAPSHELSVTVLRVDNVDDDSSHAHVADATLPLTAQPDPGQIAMAPRLNSTSCQRMSSLARHLGEPVA